MAAKTPTVLNEIGKRIRAAPVFVVGQDGSDRVNSVKDVTLTLDTSVYAGGDVLADTQVIDAAFRVADGAGVIQTIMLIDKDDQKSPLTLFFLDANVTLGTENSAPSISDANAASILGFVDIAAADYRDLGGVSVVNIKGIGLPVKAISATDDLAIAAMLTGSGTPTYTAAGIVVRLGMSID